MSRFSHVPCKPGSGYSVREIREGKLSRSLNVAGAVDPDGIRAESEDGLLTVSMTRSEESQPRTIEATVR